MHRAYISGWQSRLPENDSIEYFFTDATRFAKRWYIRIAAEMFVKQLSAGIKVDTSGGEIICHDFGMEEVSPGVFEIYSNFPTIPLGK